MIYRPLKTAAMDCDALAKEYTGAERVDAFRFGFEHIFIKKGLKVCYLPYNDVTRYFRRIVAVPLKISCCGGVMELQNIVFCDDERELAMVQLKDPRMLDTVLSSLRERLKCAAYGKPQDMEERSALTQDG